MPIVDTGPATTITLHTDGATAPTNPGPSGAGAWADRAGEVLFTLSQPVGQHTSNEAEYLAVALGLRRLLSLRLSGHVHVLLDSQIVARQLRNESKVSTPTLIPYYESTCCLLSKFDGHWLAWVPREQNILADFLSTQALKKKQPAGPVKPLRCR
jgi:ribonuclease HI